MQSFHVHIPNTEDDHTTPQRAGPWTRVVRTVFAVVLVTSVVVVVAVGVKPSTDDARNAAPSLRKFNFPFGLKVPDKKEGAAVEKKPAAVEPVPRPEPTAVATAEKTPTSDSPVTTAPQTRLAVRTPVKPVTRSPEERSQPWAPAIPSRPVENRLGKRPDNMFEAIGEYWMNSGNATLQQQQWDEYFQGVIGKADWLPEEEALRQKQEEETKAKQAEMRTRGEAQIAPLRDRRADRVEQKAEKDNANLQLATLKKEGKAPQDAERRAKSAEMREKGEAAIAPLRERRSDRVEQTQTKTRDKLQTATLKKETSGGDKPEAKKLSLPSLPSPFGNKEEAAKEKEAPAMKKEEPAEKKEEAMKKEEPAMKKEEPAKKKEEPAEKKEEAMASKEAATTKAEGAPQLPEGWKEVKDKETGKPYYYNEALDKTTWEFPSKADTETKAEAKKE